MRPRGDERPYAGALSPAARQHHEVLYEERRHGAIRTSTICERLDALAEGLPPSDGQRMLRRRIGQIALSVAKNIPAYGLTGEVKAKAISFLNLHYATLGEYALKSGDKQVRRQGMLLLFSRRLFLRLYTRLSGR